MFEKSVSRALLKFGAVATAVVLAFGTTSAAALAQDDPTSTPPAPTETSTPPTSDPAPPPPPPADEPSNEPSNERRNDPAPPPAQPEQQATPPNVSGVLYADKNRNGQQEAGEEISGGGVTIFGGPTSSEHKTTSGADGKFSFHGLAAGTYQPTYELADGWVVHHGKATGDLITVTEGARAELAVRAERPYSEQIKATLSLDRDSYHHPASARATVTLTNTTDRPITGIQARCDREGAQNALGRASGWNVFGGNGITLAVGEQRSIAVVEEIPLAARRDGTVKIDCDFAPNVGWNTDGPKVRDEATVTGGTGNYTMVLGVDMNGNGRVDSDEASNHVTVVLLNPQTNEQIAEGTSREDGKIEFTGLKYGDYRAKPLGSVAFTDVGQEQLTISEPTGFGYRFTKFVRSADLRVEVKFDKQSYQSHETVRFDMTIKNVGGQTAERVRLQWPFTQMIIQDQQWGDARFGGLGIRIPAGESRTITVSGKISSLSDGKLTVSGRVDYLGAPNPASNSYTASVDVVQTTGDVTGVVFTDKNRNGQQDPGEAAPDAVVEFSGGAPYAHRKVSTDADGRFSFIGVPSGEYGLGYTLAGGWIVHVQGDASEHPRYQVAPGAPIQLNVRAERPYSEMLKATVVLDKATYLAGDEAKATVKLTNTTSREISGITALCNKLGDNNHLGGHSDDPFPAGWGDLLRTRKGVTVGPGETKTFIVPEKVPVGARNKSMVVVSCDFAPNAVMNTDGPRGYDWASVPGGLGAVAGPLFHDRNKNHKVDPGEAIPNTRMALYTHRENGALVTQTSSDAEGNVRFDKLAPGVFWVGVDGPWRFEGSEHANAVETWADTESAHYFAVVPGPPPSTPPGDDHDEGIDENYDPGIGGGGVRGALARTGASVLGLGVVAALLVAFGIGARVAGRRKTS